MKYLLIVVMLCGFLYASDSPYVVSIDDSTIITINTSTGSIKIIPDAINILLTVYDEYKAECYADSTLIKTVVSQAPDVEPDSTGLYDYSKVLTVNAVYQTETKWVHREPTFQGYIEFLRKKVE